jgi:SAM-dependent methyltransferase
LTDDVSPHYLGLQGAAYFSWQSQDAQLTGELEAQKFRRFVRPDATVLDFGCAGGAVLRAIPCNRRVGVEANPHARDAARANGVEVYESLTHVPNGIADVTISNHALEHVPSPITVLCHLRAKTKHGGTVALCLPMEDWRVKRRYVPGDRDHHLHAWNPQTFGNALVEAGFQVRPEDISILTHCWPPRLRRVLYEHTSLSLFNALCGLSARVLRRRQLLAVLRAQ